MDDIEELKKHYRMLKLSRANVPADIEAYMKAVSSALKNAGNNFTQPRLLMVRDYSWLELKRDFTIGRASGNSLILDGDEIQDRHALVHRESTDWLIESLTDESAISINGKLIKKKILISGDLIKIGWHDFIFFRI